MAKSVKIVLVSTALIFCCCHLAFGQPQEQSLNLLKSVPNDGSIIGQVADILADNNNIFISDYESSQIIVYEKDGRLLRRIGDGAGEGPGELFRISSISLKGDSLFVANEGNGRFDLFTREGQFIETYARSYVFTSDFTTTNDGTLYGAAYKREGSNRLISRIGRDGELQERFGDMYFEDEDVVFLTSMGSIHEIEGGLVYVSEHYETVRVFEDTTETHRFDIHNEVLDDALANNKDLGQFRPPMNQSFPFQHYIQASAVHDGIVYAAFQEPEQIRILAYTINGDPYGDYVYDDIQRPDGLVVRAMDVDDEGIYLGLDDDVPKVLVFARPDQ